MPIPFHDAEDVEELGFAAFLRIETAGPGSAERRGALLFLNARGEPLEFVYNRIELLSSVLWRPTDRETAAARRLALTLFHAATLTPALLFCQAETIVPGFFAPGGQIVLHVPTARLATDAELTGAQESEALETVDADGVARRAHVFWEAEPPEGSAADLFARLAERGLLLEPFERAARGLSEAYGEPPQRGD